MPTTLDETAQSQPELDTVLNQSDATQSWTSWIASISGTDDQSARPPPLPEGVMPNITIQDFSRYLSHIGQKLDDDSKDYTDGGRVSTTHNQSAPLLDKNTTTNSNNSNNNTITTSNNSSSSSSSSLADAMKKVPLMFFQEDFSLGWTELWTHLGSIDTLDKQQMVLEQLSAQLDSIETYLIHEIGARYESFFEASVFVHELKGNVNTLLDQVTEKRQIMDTLVDETNEHAENAVHLKRKKANLSDALKLATAAQHVIHAKSALQSSLLIAPEAGLDYMGTLNILDSLQEAYDLHGSTDIIAIRSLPEYILEVKKALKEIMTSDVLEFTQFDVQKHVDALLKHSIVLSAINDNNNSDNNKETASIDGESGGGAVIDNDDSSSDGLLMQLGAPLTGLCRVDNIFDAIHSLHKELYLDMSNFLTTLTGRYLDEICGVNGVDISDGLSGTAMTRSLKSIEGNQYTILFKLITIATKQFIDHCQNINTIMNDIIDKAIQAIPEVSKNIPQRQGLDCCIRAAHGAVGCWASLLSSWTEASSMGSFQLDDLCSALDLTDTFASSIEQHAGKSMGILRGHIQDACRATIDHMHSRHMKALIRALEEEKWMYADLDGESQRIVKELESALEHQRGVDREQHSALSTSTSNNSNINDVLLVINGKGFYTVRTVQVLLSVLEQYHAFCTAVPVLTADASQRVVELLRTFNSRTCQLILGAGAMQVSGLRSISVKHLAIACHSVRAVLGLYPALQAVFVNPVLPLPRRNLIGDEYARTLQDMTTHIDEIRNKIVIILCDRLNNAPDLLSLLGSIATMPSPSSSQHNNSNTSNSTTSNTTTAQASSFASSTAKQLLILVDIMSSTSLQEDTTIVLKRVGQRYCVALAAAYGTANLQGAGLDGQLSADLTLLIESIEKLPLESATLQSYVQELKVLQRMYQHAAEKNAVLLPPSPPQSPPPHQTQHEEEESSHSLNVYEEEMAALSIVDGEEEKKEEENESGDGDDGLDVNIALDGDDNTTTTAITTTTTIIKSDDDMMDEIPLDNDDDDNSTTAAVIINSIDDGGSKRILENSNADTFYQSSSNTMNGTSHDAGHLQ